MSNFKEIIQKIINEHGDQVFENTSRTHAVLLDLAQDQVRDRLLARHFVEAGGYSLLRRSSSDINRASGMIIRRLREEFSLEPNSAAWITQLFAEAMGYESTVQVNGDLKPWGNQPPKPPAGDQSPDPDAASPIVFGGSFEVAIGMAHTVASLWDGTAVAYGRNDFLQCDVEDWRQITAVAAGDAHTVGLMADGRVIAVGRNDYDQCDVGGLEDICAVYAFGDDTICIRKDGTVSAVGKSRLDLSHFEQTRSIAWHPEGVYGIRQDGRLMMSSAGWEEEDWALGLSNVVQIISTYVMGSLVLTGGGQVFKLGEPDNYFAHLRDITSMVDLTDGFAVLRKDGMVRILPYDRSTPRKPSEADGWRDISAVFGKYKRLIGLTADGHLLAACTDPDWLKRNGSLEFLKDWYPVGKLASDVSDTSGVSKTQTESAL